MSDQPYIRIAVVHDDGTTAIYHVREIRLEAESYTVKAAQYFTTITPTEKGERT